jgi:hypothetical protein
MQSVNREAEVRMVRQLVFSEKGTRLKTFYFLRMILA